MDPDVFWQVVASLKHNTEYLLFGGIIFAAIQILDMLLIMKKLPDAET
jgi:hypothetical protein